jgi:ribosomal protein S18 acetylase RimI-like enzyme
MAVEKKVLTAPVKTFVISKEAAKDFEGLKDFRCGDLAKETNPAIREAIQEVHDIAARLYSGEAFEQRVVILEEKAGANPGDGVLVGLCGVRHLQLFQTVLGPLGMPEGGYINVLGTHERYRGYKIKKNRATTPGSRLLSDALVQLKKEFGGGPLPYVWAAVRAGNEPSLAAFRKHHFRRPPAQYPGGTVLRQGEAGGTQVMLG